MDFHIDEDWVPWIATEREGGIKQSAKSHGLLFDQAEAIMIKARIELAAAIITSHCPADGFDAMDGGKTVRADVGVIPFHFAPFEREVVERFFTRDSKVRAGSLPLGPMRIDPAAAAALVSDEVGKLVL